MMTRKTRLFLIPAVAAALALSSVCLSAAAAAAATGTDPAVAALAKQVGSSGWILFGAHPKELL